ncbi:Cytochrome c [Rubripirellula lacrimiformis]|uniref:Cytochrome c n=1 Tax=Rubripirellula lacrimiformis TaxID=1930273 RepID=A0A517N5Z6_9BACT|nr:hypothetical protein [Rubripirellula lacrimiformis]QDT02567.1 Cytochrome c [Rubripirellula lacrimiformis]
MKSSSTRYLFAILSVLAIAGQRCGADEGNLDAAQRGYRVLTETPLLSNDFTEDVFNQTWRSWPEPLRSQAEKSTPAERRAMAFDRYGLTARPDHRTDGDRKGDDFPKPLQYVVDDATGNWTMNCFACHGGSVYGTPTPGAPNSRFALQTMTEEIRATKFKLGKPLSRMDIGSLIIPLGTTNGTTNAVVFGMGLMASRDTELNLVDAPLDSFTHHDMDAPPWWHFGKRPSMYIDGFAAKGHRGLMQFALIPENGPEFFRDHEDEFRDVYAYLSSLDPPRYSGPIDTDLAQQGRALFNQTCAQCHGTYGDDEHYPNRRIPIEDIGTDPVRLRALSIAGRQKYADSWFNREKAVAATDDEGPGTREHPRDLAKDRPDDVHAATIVDPDGYVAPPLDGVWASPPYFHNGSVPTLWHVLHPSDRPVVWRRTGQEMDQQRVGFSIQLADKVPLTEPDVAIRRSYFDTRRFGKSRAGHDYPDQLDENQKRAVLEYLKTL